MKIQKLNNKTVGYSTLLTVKSYEGLSGKFTDIVLFSLVIRLWFDTKPVVRKVVLTAAITLTSLFASANNIIVQSGKTVVKLDSNRVAYVLSRTRNVSVRQALTNGTQTIRNNGQADIICAILKGKRN